MNTVSGKIIAILAPQSGESKNNPGTTWKRQEFVLETQDMYPRKVCFNIWGEDRIKQADIQMDDIVTIEFEINSREYNGKWYTNIEARNISKENATAAPVAPPASSSTATAPGGFDSPIGAADDLPF